MKGWVEFRHDVQSDLIIATPHWNIETEDDVRTWYRQYVDYMSKFNRAMDLVAVLDDFKIAPAMGVYWGQYRAKVHQQFTRFSYRVQSNQRVKLFVNTSGVRYSVATQEAATVADAIEGIKAARRDAQL